ncbi:MAG: glycosyltransferase, partial [Clostridia bacterium]
MKILLVCDQFYSANNGMTISARRFAAVLKMHGHEVRVLSYGNPEDVEDLSTAYLLKKQYIPMFDKLVASQGMTFAKYDEEVADRAVEWADVIHFLTPFVISHNVIKLAQKTGKPFTAAFHVQPENVTASIHLGKANFVNDCIYAWFKSFVFKYCSHIHCPSRFIANELEKHGYKQMLHVISNGIDPDFVYRKIPKKPEYANKFLIVSVGRMSIEKRQDLIISAVKKSKYFHQIKLVLAGKGPRKESLIALAKRLDVPVKIEFFSKSDLLDLLAMSDLYVHASDME